MSSGPNRTTESLLNRVEPRPLENASHILRKKTRSLFQDSPSTAELRLPAHNAESISATDLIHSLKYVTQIPIIVLHTPDDK
jgi:hypothetical protein